MKIGLTTGCFDKIHAGHTYLLGQAALQCDYLIVAVNTDDWCTLHKGPGRPFRGLEDRIWAVKIALSKRIPSAVIPFEGDDAALALVVQPDVIFRGFDQSETPSTIPVIRLRQLPGYSTTLLASKEGVL